MVAVAVAVVVAIAVAGVVVVVMQCSLVQCSVVWLNPRFRSCVNCHGEPKISARNHGHFPAAGRSAFQFSWTLTF